MTQIIDTFPAYTIVRNDDRAFEEGDRFAMGFTSLRGDRLYNFYTLGSVEGYAAKYKDDVAAAVERAKDLGHQLYWANTDATVIHSGPKSHDVVIGIEPNDVITFKGKRFKVEKVDRHNVKLVEVD